MRGTMNPDKLTGLDEKPLQQAKVNILIPVIKVVCKPT